MSGLEFPGKTGDGKPSRQAGYYLITLNPMTKDEFMELVGESPEDIFGPDWENIIQELNPLPQNKNARHLPYSIAT